MPEFAVKLNSNHFVIGLGENTVLSARERALAEAARIEAAASAAYAESMTGPSYANAAAGLAATSDGQGFAVDNGDGTVTVYLNDGGVAAEQRTLATTAYLASQDGAKAIGVKQRGASALLRTAEDALRDIPTRAGYPTTAASIAAAVAGDFVVGVTENLTVNIPSDAATLRVALERLTPLNRQCTITLNIESGHSLTASVPASGKDYSQFRIVSVDPTVPISFTNSSIFAGTNGSRMPRLACVIDAANQLAGDGIRLDASMMTVEAGAGVINAYETGLATYNGSVVHANGSVFSGAGRAGTTQACITAWASFVSADGADCTNSNYYGVQAAHGGVLAFRNGNASGAYRHGIRASDAGLVDADGASANSCGADGAGSNIRAFEAGIINFVGGTANNNLATTSNPAAYYASGAGSVINARNSTSTGSLGTVVYANGGAIVNAAGGTISAGGGLAVNFDSTVITSVIGETNGTYTPTVTSVANLTGTPSATAQFIRVGNTVTVSGTITGIQGTAAADTSTSLRMSLPLPSNIATVADAGGAGAFYTVASRGNACAIYADTTNKQALFNWASKTTSGSQAMSFSFTYRIR